MSYLNDSVFLKKQEEKLKKNLKRLKKVTSVFGKQKNGKVKVNFPNIGNGEDDNIQEVRQYEENVSIENNLQEMISKHEKALEKIKNGKYGLCEVCKKPIAKDRLDAFPDATACTKHAK
jgi:RNA polymerase-binding transcription factor DksA